MDLKLNLKKRAMTAALACAAVLCAAPRADAQSRVFPTDLTNIAAAANGGRIIASSSTFNDDQSYAAANLIDGKLFNPNDAAASSNGWASNKYDSVAMETITLGFGDNAQKRIGKIVMSSDTAVAPERWAKDVEIQVSTTGADGPYRVAAQLTLKRSAERQEFAILPVEARFVRLVFRSNWGSDRAVALGEIEMYESIRTDNAIGQVIARLEGAIIDLERYRKTQEELSNSAVGAVTVGTEAKTSNATSTISSAKMQPSEAMRLVADGAATNATAAGATATNATAAGATAATSSTREAGSGRSVNIAASANGGRIVGSTSTFKSDVEYGPENLIDGKNFSITTGVGSNGWASEGFASGKQSVTIGFKDDRTRLINKIIVNPVSNQNSLRWATRVEVQATNESPTDGPFRTITTLNIRLENVNQDFVVKPFEAKYVRFVFTANGPGNPLPQGDPNVSSDRAVSLGEIEIYEPSLAGDDLKALIGRFNQDLTDMKRLRAEDKIADPTE